MLAASYSIFQVMPVTLLTNLMPSPKIDEPIFRKLFSFSSRLIVFMEVAHVGGSVRR